MSSGKVKPSVLIVEDNKKAIELLTLTLQENYDVIFAKTVSEARFKLQHQKFHCVISDQRIGPFEASDLICDIKTKETINTKTPVILMSGPISREDILRMKSYITKILTKPFRPSELSGAVEQLVAMAAS